MRLVNPLRYAGIGAVVTVLYLPLSGIMAGSFGKPKEMLLAAILYSALGVYLLITFHKYRENSASKVDKLIFSVSSVFVSLGLIFGLYNVWIAFRLILI